MNDEIIHLQLGDVAVLDISAETIEQDESAAKRIPSAESKGFPSSIRNIFSSNCNCGYYICL